MGAVGPDSWASPTEISIQALGPENLDVIAEVIFQSQQASERSPSKIRECLASLRSCRPRMAVAAQRGAFCGVTLGCDHHAMSHGETDLPIDTFYLVDLAVLPVFRRRGIAELLVTTLIRDALSDYRSVFLHVRPGTVCDAVFRRHGFTPRADYGGRTGLFADQPALLRLQRAFL